MRTKRSFLERCITPDELRLVEGYKPVQSRHSRSVSLTIFGRPYAKALLQSKRQQGVESDLHKPDSVAGLDERLAQRLMLRGSAAHLVTKFASHGYAGDLAAQKSNVEMPATQERQRFAGHIVPGHPHEQFV